MVTLRLRKTTLLVHTITKEYSCNYDFIASRFGFGGRVVEWPRNRPATLAVHSDKVRVGLMIRNPHG